MDAFLFIDRVSSVFYDEYSQIDYKDGAYVRSK